MGSYTFVENLEKRLAMSRRTPMILNDFQVVTKEQREKLASLTRSHYIDQDFYSTVPSCDCAFLTGKINLRHTCPECSTEVQHPMEGDVDFRMWFRAPEGVDSFISPVILLMLREHYKYQSFNFIHWLIVTDTTQADARPQREIEMLLDMGIKRGLNFFVQNFFQYLDCLNRLPCFTKKDSQDLMALLQSLYDKDPVTLFPRFIPIPNKSQLVMETASDSRFVDVELLEDVFDAIEMMKGIDTPFYNYRKRQRENRAAKSLIRMSNYYHKGLYSLLSKKSGWYRKEMFGFRTPFSTRAVISSNSGKHRYDEIQLSWGQMVTTFDRHLHNLLMNRGYTPSQAIRLVKASTLRYNPLIDELLTKLLKDTPNSRGFVAIFIRNPSLTRSSTQAVWINGYKKDPRDITTSMSPLVLVGYVADFDGDAMTTMPMLDQVMTEGVKNLAPHVSVCSLNAPRTLTGLSIHPKPISSAISSYLSDKWRGPVTDPKKIAFMQSLTQR